MWCSTTARILKTYLWSWSVNRRPDWGLWNGDQRHLVGPHGSQKHFLLSPLLTAERYVVSAIPLNLLTIDWLGRKWTLGMNFLGAGIFLFLAQICSSHTVFLTVTLFGVRSFISGCFKISYIYTSEVSLLAVLTILYTVFQKKNIH